MNAQMISNKSQRSIMRILARECGADTEDEIRTMLASANLVETVDIGGDEILLNGDAWEDVEFEVALDSGAVVHVCAEEDAPGYALEESPGSKRGQHFLMGDGGKVPNQGQKSLNLAGSIADLKSIFQIAKVTRPLISVGKICDEGVSVNVLKTYASVMDAQSKEFYRFERQQEVYTCPNLN